MYIKSSAMQYFEKLKGAAKDLAYLQGVPYLLGRTFES